MVGYRNDLTYNHIMHQYGHWHRKLFSIEGALNAPVKPNLGRRGVVG